jgi:hypothetical protein
MRVFGCFAAAFIIVSIGHTQIITNPGFESGLSGWTQVIQPSSSGGFSQQSGTLSVLSALPVPVPPQGSFAVMSDQTEPGSYVLYQNFVVPTFDIKGELSLYYFIHNYAFDFAVPTPETLTTNLMILGVPNNQQARIDIMTASSAPFSTAPSDVLANVFKTDPGDTLNTVNYVQLTDDLTGLLQSHAGETLRLRFAVANNSGNLHFGIDDIHFVTPASAPVPEPSSYAIVGAALLSALVVLRRRTANQQDYLRR